MIAFASSSEGMRIAYEAHGAGQPALVFVHGWSCDRTYWKAQLLDLSASALVVALDLAGHGESGSTRRDWSIAAFGADVTAVVNDLGLENLVLVGHSMGVDVILEAARHLKGRVAGLVWVDQYSQLSHFVSEDQVRERIAAFRADFVNATESFVRRLFPTSADPSLVDRISADMASSSPQVALCCLEATWNNGRNVPKILSELHLPVVAINAQRSSTDVASMLELGVEVVVMAEVGHFPMLERPLQFNECLAQVVRKFMGRHGSAE